MTDLKTCFGFLWLIAIGLKRKSFVCVAPRIQFSIWPNIAFFFTFYMDPTPFLHSGWQVTVKWTENSEKGLGYCKLGFPPLSFLGVWGNRFSGFWPREVGPIRKEIPQTFQRCPKDAGQAENMIALQGHFCYSRLIYKDKNIFKLKER